MDETKSSISFRDFMEKLRGCKPLTGTEKHAKHQITEEQMPLLCFLDNGMLLVEHTSRLKLPVMTFINRLARLRIPFEEVPVEPQYIVEAYKLGASQISSDMQIKAKELFNRATRQGASDIHIRTSENLGTSILFRIDGDLELKESLTCAEGNRLISTLYQSMADVSDPMHEVFQRQGARIADRTKIPTDLDGIRIATTPQVDGSLMVLRLLYNNTSDSNDLAILGFANNQVNDLKMLKKKKFGIVVISGPTGSGKSTTLQRALNSIIEETKGRKHVITVEDPPEYPIDGAVQTPVTDANSEEEKNKAFQEAISATMRLDPDYIMIGEVRDTPSAQLAFRAAMTGHGVWTTLHANNWTAVFDRLQDLKMPMSLLCNPSIVTGIISQRLVKLLCPKCKLPLSQVIDRYAREDVDRLMQVFNPITNIFVQGNGCAACRNKGITGRTVIAETVVTDYTLLDLIYKNDRAAAVRYWKEKLNGITIVEHAIEKVRNGVIDPFAAEEVVGLLDQRLY